MKPEDIKQLIESGIPSSTAKISGEDGRHFTAIVVSAAFQDKNRIQKQQLVYATLKDYIADGSLHAISIKTYTPDEWLTQNKE